MIEDSLTEFEGIDVFEAFEEMVKEKKKDPQQILAEITPFGVDLIHMTLGLCTEAGELATSVKKATMYNKELDVRNVIEELGDLMFYIQGMLLTIQKAFPGVDLKDVMLMNIDKLNKRYKKGFTNEEASLRADKIGQDE